jgi:hypothetical protein
VTVRRPDVTEEIAFAREPRRLPVVLSLEEVARFLVAVPGLKHKAVLSVAYAAGHRRVHPPLPRPRPARRFPSHPSLRSLRQRPARYVVPEINRYLAGLRKSQDFVANNRGAFDRAKEAIMAMINENGAAGRRPRGHQVAAAERIGEQRARSRQGPRAGRNALTGPF